MMNNHPNLPLTNATVCSHVALALLRIQIQTLPPKADMHLANQQPTSPQPLKAYAKLPAALAQQYYEVC